MSEQASYIDQFPTQAATFFSFMFRHPVQPGPTTNPKKAKISPFWPITKAKKN